MKKRSVKSLTLYTTNLWCSKFINLFFTSFCGVVFMGVETERKRVRRYILNSAVITAPGVYEYRLISPQEAKAWFYSGERPLSTIGYEETAAALSEMLGAPVPVNRVTIKMEPGDEALVFRLVLPPGTPRIDPKDKGRIMQVLINGYWELGLLKRLK